MRNYERLSIEDFGKHLIDSGDLDPVYIALANLEFDDEGQLFRWLVAYWCFYHCGVACWLCEKTGAEFWDWFMVAAENATPSPIGPETRWPRGSERRHFRGKQAIDAVSELRQKYGDQPEKMVIGIMEACVKANGDYKQIVKHIETHRGFGSWISFKIADMMERVLEQKVDFSEAAVFMFDDPKQAAIRLWRIKLQLPDAAKPKDERDAIHQIVTYLTLFFKDYSAPPTFDRPIGLQEVETILCKWKSHMNGHYPLENDIKEIKHGVEPWTKCSKIARLFQWAMPKGFLNGN